MVPARIRRGAFLDRIPPDGPITDPWDRLSGLYGGCGAFSGRFLDMDTRWKIEKQRSKGCGI